MTRCSAAYCWIKRDPIAAFECMGITSKRRRKEALAYIHALEEAGAIMVTGHEETIKKAIEEIGIQTEWLKAQRGEKKTKSKSVTSDQKDTEVPLQEVMEFSPEDLEAGLNSIIETLYAWRDRCKEKDLDKLETRLAEFYAYVLSLKRDLDLDVSDSGIGL